VFKRRITHRLMAGVAVLGGAVALAACGSSSSSSNSSSGHASTGGGVKLAFIMPCSTCASRFEQQDKPDFISAVRSIDPSAHVIADNSQGSDATQISQVEDALANGAKVIVISPLDTATGLAVVSNASQDHVPVIAYDGLLTGAKIAFYVSFENTLVGQMQGNYLVQHLPKGSTVAMINGDQTSAPGVQFKQGALSALKPAFASSQLKLGYTADTRQFDPATAETEMQQALTKLHNNVQGVLSPNDGIAGGVIAALKSQHLDGKVLVTGQDATSAGLQDILLGAQAMTVFKPIVQEATTAAKEAVALAKGQDPAGGTTVNNGAGQVPSVLLTPIVITKSNIATVVKYGGATWAQICSGIPASKCPAH
jgi:D-xylose transport system substrate-binding protein